MSPDYCGLGWAVLHTHSRSQTDGATTIWDTQFPGKVRRWWVTCWLLKWYKYHFLYITGQGKWSGLPGGQRVWKAWSKGLRICISDKLPGNASAFPLVMLPLSSTIRDVLNSSQQIAVTEADLSMWRWPLSEYPYSYLP